MAQLRDFFAVRDGGANDTERDESPPEAKQKVEEGTPVETHLEMQSFSGISSKSEELQFVYEYLEGCSKPLVDVLNDTSQAHDTSNSEPEKSENDNLADSATLTGGESATDIPDKTSHSNEEAASAELQNINRSVSKAEGKNLRQDMIHECTSNIESEPADSVVSVVSSKSLVSQTSSFTFGTVVAPLYHQVFDRVGSKNQSVGDGGNPVRAKQKVRDLTQSYHESSCTVATDHTRNYDRVQENVSTMQESNQECLEATVNNPPVEVEDASLSVTANDVLDPSDTLQVLVQIHSDQRCTNLNELPQHTGNSLNIDMVNAPKPKESLYPQGEVQEDNMTYDLQTQATAETAQAQLPEHNCSQNKTNLETTHAQREAQEVMTSVETSFLSHQPSVSKSECFSHETDQHASSSGENVSEDEDETNGDSELGKTVTILTTNAISGKDKPLERSHDLTPHPSQNSVAEETVSSCISCCEIVDENDFTTHETSREPQEETDDVEERNSDEDETQHSADTEVADEPTESKAKVGYIHGDVSVQFKDEHIVSERAEHCGMEAAVSTQEDCSSAEPTKVKHWDMSGMVEEREKHILKNEEGSEAVSLRADNSEAVERDQVGQLEDTETETVFENTDAKETDKGEKDNNTEDEDVLEDKQHFGVDKIREFVSGKDGEYVDKELEYDQDTQRKTISGGDEPVEQAEVEKKEEEEGKEKHFTENQEVHVEKTAAQKEEIEAEKEVNIYVESEDKTSVEWKNHKDEMLVEAGEETIVDAESEGMTLEGREDEVGCSEERQEITQNELEDDLSAPVNNLQGKDKGNTGGQHAHIPAAVHFYKEEDFHSNHNVTHDRSKGDDETAAAEECLCILTDDPESDQTSHDGASAESDSDDEVELYMHCLRAVHSGKQADKDKHKDAGVALSKRPSVSRSKNLSTPMPSISESLDEEHLSCLQDHNEDMEKIDVQPTATALTGAQECITGHVSWWKETFSCSNISKTLACATSLVIFLIVAYHYDFLACFVLYLVSLVWLCCQGETQPSKNNNRIG